MLLRFENGCIGESTVSYVLRHPQMASGWDLMPIQIYGRRGSLQMDMDDIITIVSDRLPDHAGPGILHLHARPPVGAARLPIEGMAGAIDHLFDCLTQGREPLTNGEDARKSLELVEAAYRSLQEHRAVTLPLSPTPVTPGQEPSR